MYKNLDVISSLNEIHFYKLGGMKCGESLSTFLLLNELDACHFKGNIYFLLHIIYSYTIKVKEMGSGKYVFCYTPSYADRDDYRKDIHDVAECAKDYILFESVKRRKIHFNRIVQIPLIIKWVRQMKGIKMPITGKYRCAEYMLLGYAYTREIEKEVKKRNLTPRIVTTFCDVHVCDYFVTSAFNEKGIVTATLQHGLFSSVSNKYSNLYSRSRYFLGINEYSKKEFIKSGRAGDNFRVLGLMKYIKNQPDVITEKKDNKVFGLALTGIQFEAENEKLIYFGRKISHDYGYKSLIRLHPTLSNEKYSQLLKDECFEIDHSINPKSFADKCDFVIVGKSSMFSEMIAENIAAFRLYDEIDIYDGINSLRFSCWEELRDLVEKYIKDYGKLQKELNDLRSLFCAQGIIAENYRNFYMQFK